jgi:hypothetical protein
VYLLIDGREWSVYPFLPVIVNLIFLVLAWPLGAALDRQTRTYLRDQDLDVARINDVANLATDLSLKLSFTLASSPYCRFSPSPSSRANPLRPAALLYSQSWVFLASSFFRTCSLRSRGASVSNLPEGDCHDTSSGF